MEVQTTTENTRLKDHTWLIILIFSLLLSTLILAWQSRPQACLTTSMNLSLEIKLSEGTQKLENCEHRKNLEFNEFVFEQINSINRRLKYAEKVLESFGVVKARIGALAVLPEELLNPGSLESRVLARGLWKSPAKTMTEFRERQLFQAALDYFWFGGHRSKDLFSDWEQAFWNEGIRGSLERDNLILRESALRDWYSRLKEGRISYLNAKSDFTYRESAVKATQHVGYDSRTQRLQFPKAVLIDSSLSPESVELENVAVFSQDRFRPAFSQNSFSIAQAPAIHVGELFIVVCRWPYVDELQYSRFNFQSLVLVQNCDGWSNEVVNQALKDLRVFAVNHPEMNFLKIHWASFQMALHKAGVKENMIKNLFSENSLKSFTKAGLLTEIAFDEETQIKAWKGVLEPFPIFRVR